MLSVHEINRFMDGKRRDKFSTFEKIYSLCEKHVMKYASNDRYRCMFTVPEFMLGLPIYNLNTAILYVIEKLHSRGFLVKYYHPNILYICWDIDEINGRKKVRTSPGPPTVQVPPRLTLLNKTPFFPPPPEQTRLINKSDMGIIMPQTPKYDLPLPQSSSHRNANNSNFIKSISEYRPSGKFAIDV